MTNRIELTRRHWLLLTSAWFTSAPNMAAAAVLPTTLTLGLDLAKALARHQPLLVMVSLDGCAFCKIVRDNYLGPMRERAGLEVVQIDMRNKASVVDFQGKLWTQDDLIRSWGVKVAPTVLFFGKGGVEVAERMVGAYIPDFYGAYLDDRLRTALAAVKS